jgi:hypothetical protein
MTGVSIIVPRFNEPDVLPELFGRLSSAAATRGVGQDSAEIVMRDKK